MVLMLLRRYHEKTDEGQATTGGLDPAAAQPTPPPRRQRTRKGEQPRQRHKGE